MKHWPQTGQSGHCIKHKSWTGQSCMQLGFWAGWSMHHVQCMSQTLPVQLVQHMLGGSTMDLEAAPGAGWWTSMGQILLTGHILNTPVLYSSATSHTEVNNFQLPYKSRITLTKSLNSCVSHFCTSTKQINIIFYLRKKKLNLLAPKHTARNRGHVKQPLVPVTLQLC